MHSEQFQMQRRRCLVPVLFLVRDMSVHSSSSTGSGTIPSLHRKTLDQESDEVHVTTNDSQCDTTQCCFSPNLNSQRSE